MKNTPGPWKLINDNSELLIVSDKFGPIANIPVSDRHPHIEEHVANATLIAVAPELLQFLEGLINSRLIVMDSAHEKGELLLKKAKGL